MSEVASKRQPTPYAWEIVALLWVAYFLNQADRQIFGVTLSLIRRDFGLSDTQMGLVATTFTIAFGILVPVAGVLGDRLRREYVVVLSLVVFSAGTLLTGAATGLVSLLLFRGVATGVGEALYAPAANTLIAQHHVATRTRALAVHQTANYTGVVIGSLFAGWVADRFGWRASFATFGVVGLAWALFLMSRARGAPPAAHRALPRSATAAGDSLEAIRIIARSPALAAQAVGFSGLVFVLVGYLTWMPTILTERFGLTLAEAGFQAVFLHHLVGYGGLLAAGWASDRWFAGRPVRRLVAMGSALVVSAPWIWLSGAGSSPALVYVGLALFGLTRGVYDANLYAAIFDHAPDRLRATVTSWIVACAYLVGAIAPTAMGALRQRYGVTAGMDLLALVALGSGIVFLLTLLPLRGAAGPAAVRDAVRGKAP